MSTLISPQATAEPAYRSTLAAFGTCNAKKNPALAREFIVSNLDYFLPDRFRALSRSDRLGSGTRVDLHTSPVLVRYVIADALVKMDLPNFDPTVFRAAAPLAELVADPSSFKPASSRAVDLAERDKAIVGAKEQIAFIKYGECVVRSGPATAKKLLESKVDSASENSAFGELVPVLRNCLDKGQQFTASRMPLRGVIAFNYYRLAYAPRRPQSSAP